MALPLFARPVWCLGDCLSDEYRVPMSDFPKFSNILVHSTELACLCMFFALVTYRKSFTRYSNTGRIREFLLYGLIVSAGLDNVSVLLWARRIYIAHFIRPFLFVLFLRVVRNSAKKILLVLYEAKGIFFLLFFHVLAFAWIGTIMFNVGDLEDIYFPHLYEGMWNMFLLLTSVNFPDIMMPGYKESRLYFIFFFIYLVIGYFFLLELVLAAIYNAYRVHIEREVSGFIEKKDKLIREAFHLLDYQHHGYIPKETFERLILCVKSDLELASAKESFKTVIRNYSIIYLRDFRHLIDHFLSNSKNSSAHVLTRLPYISRFKKIAKNPYYEFSLNMINLSNVILLVLSESMGFPWVRIQWIYLALYCTEALILFIALGPRHTWKSLSILLQLTLNASMVPFLINQTLKALKVISAIRMLRVLNLLSKKAEFRIISKTFTHLIPAFSNLLAILTTLFYLFGEAGIELFGGKIYSENSIAFENIPRYYEYANFNDFPSALLTLFILAVVNNWNVICLMYTNVMGPWSRLFFVSFYILAVLTTMNLIIAFIIERFIREWTIEKRRKTREETIFSRTRQEGVS